MVDGSIFWVKFWFMRMRAYAAIAATPIRTHTCTQRERCIPWYNSHQWINAENGVRMEEKTDNENKKKKKKKNFDVTEIYEKSMKNPWAVKRRMHGWIEIKLNYVENKKATIRKKSTQSLDYKTTPKDKWLKEISARKEVCANEKRRIKLLGWQQPLFEFGF